MKNTTLPKLYCQHCIPNCEGTVFTTAFAYVPMESRDTLLSFFNKKDEHNKMMAVLTNHHLAMDYFLKGVNHTKVEFLYRRITDEL